MIYIPKLELGNEGVEIAMIRLSGTREDLRVLIFFIYDLIFWIQFPKIDKSVS